MAATRWVIILVLGLTVLAVLVWPRYSAGPDQAPVEAYVPVSTGDPVTPVPDTLNLDPRKVALGRILFHDRRLSSDDSIACADCHDLTLGGADARPVAVGIEGQLGSVNSPTVLNSAFNFRQFWDGRAATLEEQAEGPIHNPIEMGSNWTQVLGKLRQDRALVQEFKAIWPDGLQPANIQSAIAEFERSLLTPDAPFDRYLKGDHTALTLEEVRGWRLFNDLGCVACHQGVNLGGNMYANLGVMGDYFADRGRPIQDSDLGLFNVTADPADRHVFKVPGLRNVVITAPYFHDGSISTLGEAVDTMARYQLGMRLGEAQRQYLLAFLNSLTGQLQEKAP